jgi:hypothetical protein
MQRVLAIVAALTVALGAASAAAGEQPAPPPPPGHWILVVPPGSNILVPGFVPQPASRELLRLRRVMEIEGPEFSQERYDLYRSQKGWGIALTVIGGVALGFSYVYTIAGLLIDGSAWGAVGLVGGAACIGIGIPLMVHGIRGKGRQALLKRKDEIMRGPYWTAGVSAGPGGAGLGAAIAF